MTLRDKKYLLVIDSGVWMIIITIIICLIIMGFASNIHFLSCSMPELTIDGENIFDSEKICPNICDCNNTYEKCQIPACDYTRCWLSWYNICMIHK